MPLFSRDNRVINSICVPISQDRVLGLHGVSTVSATAGVVSSSPSANVSSSGIVSCGAPRLSHTPPHDYREVLASPMQPQPHQYYAPQYNPLHFPQQQQPRFDFTHSLEQFQTAHSQQFGNGPAAFHPSSGAPHQPLSGPTHPPTASQHQARLPLRARPSDVEALQQAHINQYAGAMEHARRREELFSAVRRPPDHMFDMIAPGSLADTQVKPVKIMLILLGRKHLIPSKFSSQMTLLSQFFPPLHSFLVMV